METQKATKPREIGEFSVFVKNTLTNREEAFRVTMVPNQTLLQAMQAFNYPKFSFETKTVPGSGPYLVKVNGMKAENKSFWETLLYNGEGKDVIPISLFYQLCQDDNIYLRLAQL